METEEIERAIALIGEVDRLQSKGIIDVEEIASYQEMCDLCYELHVLKNEFERVGKNIVELPCKMGDTFIIDDEDDEPYIVVSFECDSESDWGVGFTEYGHNCCTNFMSFKDFLSDCKIVDLEE